jgi:hypothetical protein
LKAANHLHGLDGGTCVSLFWFGYGHGQKEGRMSEDFFGNGLRIFRVPNKQSQLQVKPTTKAHKSLNYKLTSQSSFISDAAKFITDLSYCK